MTLKIRAFRLVHSIALNVILFGPTDRPIEYFYIKNKDFVKKKY